MRRRSQGPSRHNFPQPPKPQDRVLLPLMQRAREHTIAALRLLEQAEAHRQEMKALQMMAMKEGEMADNLLAEAAERQEDMRIWEVQAAAVQAAAAQAAAVQEAPPWWDNQGRACKVRFREGAMAR